MHAIPLEGVEETLKWLKESLGVEVSASGGIAKEREPRWNIHEDFKPMRGLVSALMRTLQEKQQAEDAEGRAAAIGRMNPAEALALSGKAAAHQRHQVRIRSAAGVGVHDWVQECPNAVTVTPTQ